MLAWWRACERIRIIEKYMSYLEKLPSLSAYEKGQLFVLGGAFGVGVWHSVRDNLVIVMKGGKPEERSMWKLVDATGLGVDEEDEE